MSNPSGAAERMSFIDSIINRRSIYTLSKESPIPDSRIHELLTTIIQRVPSAFDSQTSRIILLLNEEHDKFWDLVKEAMTPHLDNEEKRKASFGRLAGFKAGKGTVLFFEDFDKVGQMQDNVKAYAEHFPTWAEHTSAMHQYAAWTAFAAEGLGCNLQHYNGLVDDKVQETWNVSKTWKFKAQLVFGGKAEGWKEQLKEKKLEGRDSALFVYGEQK